MIDSKETTPGRDEKAFQFQAHRPERRRGTVLPEGIGCCCSSSCCCLHSVGGLAGAALASSTKKDPDREAARTAVYAYWGLLGLIIFVLFMLMLMGYGGSDAWIDLALSLPLVQLAASALAALVVLIQPPERRRAALAKIGSLTLKTFLGALLGLLGMLGLFAIREIF